MIILNEKEFAMRCLQDGLCGERPYQVAMVLAKYYALECGYKPRQILNALKEFFDQYYPDYHNYAVLWDENFKRILQKCSKAPLREISGVSIRASEIERIQKLSGKATQRLMFTLLCLAKFGNLKNKDNNNWVNYDWKTIFQLARVNGGQSKSDYVAKLYDAGFIELSRKISSLNIRVVHIDDGGKEALFISDFRELGYEYEQYCGGEFFRCGECERLVKKSRTNRIYCDDCKQPDQSPQKVVICEDCGHAFFTSAKDSRSTRCVACRTAHKRELDRIRKGNQRERAKMSRDQNTV